MTGKGPQGPTDHWLMARLAGVQGACFFLLGLHLPFFPVWLETRGLEAGAIGALLGLTFMARAVTTPLAAFGADMLGDRVRVFRVAAPLLLASFGLLSLASGFCALLAAALLASSLLAVSLPLNESLSITGAAKGHFAYAHVRLAGSVTFVVGNFAGGQIIAQWGAGAVIWGFAGASALLVLAVLGLPQGLGRIAREGGEAAIRVTPGAALRLARHPAFLLFMVSASAVQASHAVYYGFSSIEWLKGGYSESTVAALWALGVVAEIVFFAAAGRAREGLSPTLLLQIGAGGALLRWLLMLTMPGLVLTGLAQTLHALSFGAAHLGAMLFIARAAPAHLATTAQSLYGALSFGLFIGAATFAAGELYAVWGAGAYWLAAALAVAGLAGVWVLERHWTGGRIDLPQTGERLTPERGL